MKMIQRILAWGLILTCLIGLSWPGVYADDKLDGPAKSYYTNGHVQEEWTFKDGKREGPAKNYYKYGELKAEYRYKNDKEDGPVTVYWENGKVMRVGFYKDGKADGIWNDLHGDGRVESERFFKNGQEEGTSKYYRANGKIKGEFVYKNGRRESSQEYYSAGFLWKECDYKNGKVCQQYSMILPQELIGQMEKKLATINDISYTTSTSVRPQGDESAAWTEIVRASRWYKSPNLAKEDSIRLSLPGKPESHWVFKMEENSLIAYEILNDGSVTKKMYPATAWASVGPPNNLISDLKRRLAGNMRSVSYDDSRKVYIISFNSPDQCIYEISADTGLPLKATFLSSDKSGTKVVMVQMNDIKINAGINDDVFSVPDQTPTAALVENQPHRVPMAR